MQRSMQDRSQPLLQAPMQLKGVQLRPLIPKLALARGVHFLAAQQPFPFSAGRLVLQPIERLLRHSCQAFTSCGVALVLSAAPE